MSALRCQASWHQLIKQADASEFPRPLQLATRPEVSAQSSGPARLLLRLLVHLALQIASDLQNKQRQPQLAPIMTLGRQLQPWNNLPGWQRVDLFNRSSIMQMHAFRT